ncbi:hypothetical protein SAMN06297251_12748 [Fulvimarina manganoxydans]|uniref:Uncharacterized protein n=1 Tax=Fulvimarina manganoxydans TaxID=937218 RepID=A0A1W2EKR1_9HYPH|nr:hypothetical protein [Fulvimarina manganoxydans]SMD10205.1 hypothetical protein SAMN06297251_12748 [Fulvimarina manganoxydans]
MKPFTEDQMQAWRDAAKRKPPRIPDNAFERFAHVRSFDIAVHPNALLLRMMCGNGDITDLRINPVLARDLAATILRAGLAAEWLNKQGDVIIPDLPPLPDET